MKFARSSYVYLNLLYKFLRIWFCDGVTYNLYLINKTSSWSQQGFYNTTTCLLVLLWNYRGSTTAWFIYARVFVFFITTVFDLTGSFSLHNDLFPHGISTLDVQKTVYGRFTASHGKYQNIHAQHAHTFAPSIKSSVVESSIQWRGEAKKRYAIISPWTVSDDYSHKKLFFVPCFRKKVGHRIGWSHRQNCKTKILAWWWEGRVTQLAVILDGLLDKAFSTKRALHKTGQENVSGWQLFAIRF